MDSPDWLKLLNEDRKCVSLSATIGDGWIREDFPYGTTVLWSDLSEETADKAIQAQIDFALSSGRNLEWKLYDCDCPADLGLRLKVAGFQEGPAETVLVIPVLEALKWSAPTDFEVCVCQSEDDIVAFGVIAQAVFGKDYSVTCDDLRKELTEGLSRNVGFLCFDGTKPVGCARLYPNSGRNFAGLYGGCVLPSHRSRGCYRALLAARARYASEAGCKNLLIDEQTYSREARISIYRNHDPL